MFYGGDHAGTSCDIAVLASGLDIRIDGRTEATISYSDMAVSLAGTDDRYLKFDGRSFGAPVCVQTGNRDIANAIRAVAPPSRVTDQLDALSSKRTRRAVGRQSVILGAAALIGIFVLALYLAFDPAVKAVVSHIPVEWEEELGRSQAAAILEQTDTCSDEELNAAVSEIGGRLVAGMGKTPFAWNVKVIDSPEVNAFALPGGYVFINRGLIEASDSPEEVAGVLAHEFQHVLARHGMKNVAAQIGLRVVLYSLVGDAQAVQGFMLDNMAALAGMKFSRSQETEADRGAVRLARRSHIDPEGFLKFMKKLEQKEGSVPAGLAILSTHPDTGSRMDDIRDLIAQKGRGTVKPFSSDWTKIKKQCSPIRFSDPDSLPD